MAEDPPVITAEDVLVRLRRRFGDQWAVQEATALQLIVAYGEFQRVRGKQECLQEVSLAMKVNLNG